MIKGLFATKGVHEMPQHPPVQMRRGVMLRMNCRAAVAVVLPVRLLL